MPGGDLVGIAHGENRVEAEMIQGLLENAGIRSLLQPVSNASAYGIGGLRYAYTDGPQRIMVRAEQAEQARLLMSETFVAEADQFSEIANAEHLEAAAGGRKPRRYGYVGGMARIYLWGFGAMALAFGVFLLLRAL
jgi:hypothetical protein